MSLSLLVMYNRNTQLWKRSTVRIWVNACTYKLYLGPWNCCVFPRPSQLSVRQVGGILSVCVFVMDHFSVSNYKCWLEVFQGLVSALWGTPMDILIYSSYICSLRGCHTQWYSVVTPGSAFRNLSWWCSGDPMESQGSCKAWVLPAVLWLCSSSHSDTWCYFSVVP